MSIEIPATYPVTCHTKHVGSGSTFVAIKGFQKDGSTFIPEAIAKGATTIVIADDATISSEIIQKIKQANVKLVQVKNTRKALAHMSAQAAGYPAKKLTIIGITGTKGKTTTAFVLAHLLRFAGYKTALMSTIKNTINEVDLSAPLTTAQPDYLHQFLKLCVDNHVAYVVMEVAAHALSLHRTDGIAFDGIIFTNFSLEHLEFYATMEDYFAAKCLIFKQCRQGAPVLANADDQWCAKLVGDYEDIELFGLQHEGQHVQQRAIKPRWLAKPTSLPQQHRFGLEFSIELQNTQYDFVCPTLLGDYNLLNMLAAVVMAYKLGVSSSTLVQAVKTLPHIPGRLERYTLPNGALCIIDYAHNPASYQALLWMLRCLTSHLIVVFGAGGNRDASRRPLMGNIAAEYADVVILTSDNPRSEDPHTIIEDIMQGVAQTHKHKIIYQLDREQAIKNAYTLSRKDSIIALLGKGPDEYQLFGGIKTRFSEKEIIQSLS